MVYPIAFLRSPSPAAVSFPAPVTEHFSESEKSEANSVQNSAQNGDTWEVFSGESQLELQLRKTLELDPGIPQDFSIGFASEEAIVQWTGEKEVVLKEVEKIFDHRFVLHNNNETEDQEIFSRAADMLLPFSFCDRQVYIAQLCSVTQEHSNCDFWEPQEILGLLQHLIVIPAPPIHREVCVAYLNRVINTTSLLIRGPQVIRSLDRICTAEQRIYDLCPTPEMPNFFLNLFCPCILSTQMETICIALEKFSSREVCQVMEYALILRDNSNLINDTLAALNVLSTIPFEERDFSMFQLQRLNCRGIVLRTQFLQHLVKLEKRGQIECVDLMNSLMMQSGVYHYWKSKDIIVLFVAIAKISLGRRECIFHLEAVIEKSNVYWTTKQIIEFLSCLVHLTAEDRINSFGVLNFLMEQPYIDRSWEASELINLFAILGSIGSSREAYVRAFDDMLTKSAVQWTADEVIKFLRCSLPVLDRIKCIVFLRQVMPKPNTDQSWKIEEIIAVFKQIASIPPPREGSFCRLQNLIQRSDRGWSAQEVMIHCQ